MYIDTFNNRITQT